MIYKLEIPTNQVDQIKRYAGMAMRFKPEMVEDAVLKVLEEDDLTPEQQDAGIGMILYADEPTYQMAKQFGAPAATTVESFPPNAQDFFDI